MRLSDFMCSAVPTALASAAAVVLRWAQFPLLQGFCVAAFPQGGPPLVSDDPGTPGDGHWEINIATVANHTAGLTQWAVPDVDLNYGWGDRIQLKLDTPWLINDGNGGRTASGLGASIWGVKWRFLDGGESGLSMSTYPQWTTNLVASSSRRELTEPGRELFLPVEISMKVASFEIDTEVGREFLTRGDDSWAVGLVVAHDCPYDVECLVEIHETLAPHDSQTLFNLGARWKFANSYALLFALGHDIGPATDSRQNVLFYLGLQILR
jgi:hypothetical protein